jgi:RNA polymerase II subunit A C-terminal domain phosphatase SSU72
METSNGNAGSAATPQNGQQEDASGFKLKFCTVCASNQNR